MVTNILLNMLTTLTVKSICSRRNKNTINLRVDYKITHVYQTKNLCMVTKLDSNNTTRVSLFISSLLVQPVLISILFALLFHQWVDINMLRTNITDSLKYMLMRMNSLLDSWESTRLQMNQLNSTKSQFSAKKRAKRKINPNQMNIMSLNESAISIFIS